MARIDDLIAQNDHSESKRGVRMRCHQVRRIAGKVKTSTAAVLIVDIADLIAVHI